MTTAKSDEQKIADGGADRIAKVRRVLTEGCLKIDGALVDSFTASAITQVYDALNDQNKAKFAALSIGRMASVAFRFVK